MTFFVDIWKEWDGEVEFKGEAEFVEHNQMTRKNSDNILIDEKLDMKIYEQEI